MSALSILKGKKIGFARTGSFCILAAAISQIEQLTALGAEVLPIISANVRDMDSRFGSNEHWREAILAASGAETIIDTIDKAEPIGSNNMTDIMLIAPCTGNSISKLANGIIDTPVIMAAKSHLRNARPLVIAISTNDGLAANARNFGQLMNYKNIFFVPFGQDNPEAKPNSLTSDMKMIPKALAAALNNQQIQPLLTCQVPL